MKWEQTQSGYWELTKDGKFLASIHHARKSFFANYNNGEEERHFSAYGIFKLEWVELIRAKKWCEQKAKGNL
jgi:hypothetical protein